jgi:hypothetical protein
MSLTFSTPLFDIDGRDNNNNQPSLTFTRHPTYYLFGADLFIRVQRVIFCIHSHFLLRESIYFQRLLTSSPHDPPRVRGTSFTQPLILVDTIPSHFAIFLWVFYNPHFGQYDTSPNNWIVIHNLAIQWQFPEVLRLAQQHLPPPLNPQNDEQDDDDEVQWDTSIEVPLEDWITEDSITEEFVQLHLNRRHLEDGAA